MTEQEEAIGRQRLGVLIQHQTRLVQLETDKDVTYPVGDERHGQAVADHAKLAAIVGRLEADAFIPQVRIIDATQDVTDAQNRSTAADAAVATHTAESAAETVRLQGLADDATADVAAAQAALAALQGP